jgi:hypothetical protein
MLPQMDGFTTCQKIRESSEVPIITVHGCDHDEDKVRGLEVGADDYITKPFSTHELASRVKSVLRRTRGGRNKNTPATTPTAEPDISFLHQRDEALTFPTQAPITGTVHLTNGSAGTVKKRLADRVPDTATIPIKHENYECALKLAVLTTGAIKGMIKFVEALRENRQIHLLKMIFNTKRDGMDVWLRLRSPNALQTALLALPGVTKIEIGKQSESEASTPVLKVFLD